MFPQTSLATNPCTRLITQVCKTATRHDVNMDPACYGNHRRADL